MPFQAGFNTTPEEDEAWAYYWKYVKELKEKKMTKTCNCCMTDKVLFKLEGAIAIYKNGKLIKYLPNEDLSDQYYCEKCAKKLDYLEDL